MDFARNALYKNRPVRLSAARRMSSGVPEATTRPLGHIGFYG